MDGPPRGSSCCVGGVLVIWTSNDGFHNIVRRLLHSSANAVFWICRCIKVHVLGTEMILRDSQASATATGCTTRCTRVRTIPGPKTPTAPENEALAYGRAGYYGAHPATASLACPAATPCLQRICCSASSNIANGCCSSLQSGRMC